MKSILVPHHDKAVLAGTGDEQLSLGGMIRVFPDYRPSFRSAAGSELVCRNGAGVDFSEERALAILRESEIHIDITLGDGDFASTAWGCDLTYEYVKINGEYRT